MIHKQTVKIGLVRPPPGRGIRGWSVPALSDGKDIALSLHCVSKRGPLLHFHIRYVVYTIPAAEILNIRLPVPLVSNRKPNSKPDPNPNPIPNSKPHSLLQSGR